MATIRCNGIDLLPQPASAAWGSEIINSKLDGTEATGSYMLFTIRTPKLAGQTFNWDQFENQVLTTLRAYAPSDRPTGTAVDYTSGVVARKIQTYQMPEDRTITGIELTIAVVV